MDAWAGNNPEFVGKWIFNDEAWVVSINQAVQRVPSRKQMWQGKQRGGEHPLVWLRDVVWNCRTGFLFARLSDERLEIEAVGNVKKIAGFRTGEGELVSELAGNLRRALQHCVAACLSFDTVGKGEGVKRHVVVRW